MKEIKKEVKTVEFEYESEDGKKFTSREACKDYERSAAFAVRAFLPQISIMSTVEDFIFPNGSPSAESHVVVPRCEQDIRDIRILESHIRSQYSVDFKPQITDICIGDVIVITIGECQEWISITDMNALVRTITKDKYEIVKSEKK